MKTVDAALRFTRRKLGYTQRGCTITPFMCTPARSSKKC
uniref:Uncharacterized protein n=1 Tax=Anguilla anguilla TaxID=7936 RepID=A0A0E9WJN4_ANGAN